MNAPAVAPPGRAVLFVDGDNVSAQHASALLHCVKGRLDVARVYGGMSHLKGWMEEDAFELRPTDVPARSKSLTDLMLSLDALKLSLRSPVGRLYLATSDGDFAVLARLLRAEGVEVIGLGEAKAPGVLRLACTRFVTLELHPDPQAETRSQPALVETVRDCIGEDWMPLTTMAKTIKDRHGITRTTAGIGQWSKWLRARPDCFEFETVGSASRVRVRRG